MLKQRSLEREGCIQSTQQVSEYHHEDIREPADLWDQVDKVINSAASDNLSVWESDRALGRSTWFTCLKRGHCLLQGEVAVFFNAWVNIKGVLERGVGQLRCV